MAGIPVISWLWRALPFLALAACVSALEGIQNSKAIEFLGFNAKGPCGLIEDDRPRLAGAHLRDLDQTGVPELLFVSGRPRGETETPRRLEILNKELVRIRVLDDKSFGGSKESVATIRDGFGALGSLPAAYDLTYQLADGAFAGPLVVGTVPPDLVLPTSQNVSFSGKAEITITRNGDTAGETSTVLVSRFRADLGFGTRQSTFELTGATLQAGDDEPPFTDLHWSNLEICGPRVFSSGAGQFYVTRPDGGRSLPLQAGSAPVGLSARFEAVMFQSDTAANAPDGYGGIFVIEGDPGRITAIFLSDD